MPKKAGGDENEDKQTMLIKRNGWGEHIHFRHVKYENNEGQIEL